ncbi:hypothetical protein [Mailhella sp.]|uniref:hypothetical protein n=1 Tax=Mailhella sp. TaxID=1981029 RepID=UPI003AB76546
MVVLQRAARAVGAFCLGLAVCLSAGSAQAAAYADFRSDVQYRLDGKAVKTCGSAMSSGSSSRLDLDLGSAGAFSLLVDANERMMRVLSHRLKAYVEIPVSGDPRDWRNLVKSAAAAVMPQSMGMISLQEKECTPLGKDNWQGYSVRKSRNVFDVSFMGSVHRFTIEVWENEAFAPFPMHAAAEETRATHGGTAWLTNIVAEQAAQSMFQIPEGFTRYTSVMDLFLYALTAF